jgi:hypothetical protein
VTDELPPGVLCCSASRALALLGVRLVEQDAPHDKTFNIRLHLAPAVFLPDFVAAALTELYYKCHCVGSASPNEDVRSQCGNFRFWLHMK